MAAARASVEGVNTAPEGARSSHDGKKDIDQVERVLSAGDEKADHANYDRVDAEVAKYADATGTVITEEENKRLKRLIDRRVLPIMVITYFLQSLDKGTMSSTSIMGIRDDIPVLKQNAYVSAEFIGILRSTANRYPYSSDGLLHVSISPFSSLNTPRTGSFNVFPSPNTSD